MKKDYTILSSTLDPIATRLRYLSANIITLSGKQLVANIRLRFNDANDARTIGKDFVAPGLTSLADVLKLYLTTPVEFRDYTIPGSTPPGTTPGTGVPPGFGTPPGTGIPPGLGTPPGLGVPPGLGMPPGGSGSGIGLPPPPPMGGGSSGGPISPIGPGGPGSIGPPGVGPGSGGNPTPKEPAASASHIDLALVDNQLLIAIDVSWSEETNRTTVEPRLVGLTNQIKGKMAIFSSESSQHATASVGPKAIEVKGMFPRGTADRVVNDRNRQGLPYPPMQRVSLFVELLPHLGHERLAGNVNKNLAWYDEKNLPAAGAWVPELLVPSYPQAAWRATSPFAPDHVFGATNYVAISGAGLDSARYDPTNPEHAKKVGITGYNWGSKASEVTDGLANTIYLLQTPPAMQQPWIAGGGATIRGFDESDPMAAFKYNHGGKQGTYALMGDGSVRFIPANINPKVLVAMGTRAGGESLADVDSNAPVVPPPKPPEVKKPEEKKEPEPKPKEPAVKPETAPEPREKK
jgi:hypothetical protein